MPASDEGQLTVPASDEPASGVPASSRGPASSTVPASPASFDEPASSPASGSAAAALREPAQAARASSRAIPHRTPAPYRAARGPAIRHGLETVCNKMLEGVRHLPPAAHPKLEGASMQCSWALAALAVLSAGAVQAQSRAIKGTVSDVATGEPVAGARAQVSGTDLSVLSGADGTFTISGAPAGAVEVVVS